MSSGEPVADRVAGERGPTLVSRAASMQSRLSSGLALALMSAIGIGSLAWYYANSMARLSRARQIAQAASVSRAQGDTVLPGIGRIDPPPASAAQPPDILRVADASADPTPPLSATTLAEIPLSPVAAAGVGGVGAVGSVGAGAYAAPPPPTPQALAEARELGGAVFATMPPALAPPASVSAAAGPAAGGNFSPGASEASAPRDLAALLRPTPTASVHAQMLPAQRLLLPRGAFIDCTLETAIDSSLPGMTTCILAADTFGANGEVVLLERGTKLIGETRGQVQLGMARVFVIWTEARTPAGVVVPLDSPGADELGRSGLAGAVNRHFWERFGAALLISVVDGAVETAATRNGNGTVIVDPSASQGVMTEALKGTVDIAPTVTKRNGDRIQVLVARDIDFRSVYELRSAGG